ncbi:Gfo/Idh/MocA family oxidoreductase [candidate division KSB1 bacterium]|nr:Gfo/Idh/MocA family oxidoreductase [candidate division KSB1 bacterium]
MQRLKIGLAGVGKLGQFHCNALSQLAEAELVGVFDIDNKVAAQVVETFRCRNFSSIDELIASVDAVGVIVPTTEHLAVAGRALEAGKPVFVEKPIASSVAEAHTLVEMAAKNNLTLQVGHIERFNPAIRALEGIDLQPRFIESHRLAPFDPRGTDVAVVLDLMIHDLDIILSLVDSKLEKLDANGVAVVSDQVDIANVRLQFENGCVANVTASRISQKKMRKMRLFQKDSYISIDFLQRFSEIFQLVDQVESAQSTLILGQIERGSNPKQIVYTKPPIPEMDAMRFEWQGFISSVRRGSRPVVSGEDGLRALQVAAEIIQRIENGRR